MMQSKSRLKDLRKKTQVINRKATCIILAFAPIRLFIKNRRAINAVISNLILIAAVIVVGLAALAYAQSTSNNYQMQYGESMKSEISQIKQVLTFEFVSYNSPTLRVYLLNSGNMNANITGISVSTLSPNFILYQMKNQQIIQVISNNTLAIGQEGCVVSSLSLTQGQAYTVKVTTKEGSVFAYNFMA